MMIGSSADGDENSVLVGLQHRATYQLLHEENDEPPEYPGIVSDVPDVNAQKMLKFRDKTAPGHDATDKISLSDAVLPANQCLTHVSGILIVVFMVPAVFWHYSWFDLFAMIRGEYSSHIWELETCHQTKKLVMPLLSDLEKEAIYFHGPSGKKIPASSPRGPHQSQATFELLPCTYNTCGVASTRRDPSVASLLGHTVQQQQHRDPEADRHPVCRIVVNRVSSKR
ncbi:unnamed protein product [Notodromas monacha]|uniref:Uncharacterized protein n=1 Tax=Notodromas monacha TaxID=399045 RepID=A0A7R9BMR7_9CRUS|nr:unnamed protein product [Notodromas monacha]CAG0917488.1 unnamed protein product [Notodromas monacha]